MSVSPERFAQGLTYDDFKNRLTKNRERYLANEQQVPLEPEDSTFFQGLGRPVHVLVLAEEWCGDVIGNLPILGRIAEVSGWLDLRIFLRDENADLMDQYLNEGKYRSIPVFVFLDEQFHEIGRFVERSAAATERRVRFQEELRARYPGYSGPGAAIAELPEDVRASIQQEMAEKRLEWAEVDARDTVRSIRAILARAVA